MKSSRIDFTRGASVEVEVDLVDDDGVPVALADLEGAVAEFILKVAPSDGGNILHFTSPSSSIDFIPNEASLLITFVPGDTAAVPLLLYVFQVKVTLATGDVKYAIDWSPFDLNLGGVAAPEPPVFDETTAVNHDYDMADNLRYMTPGGSPISGAQVRVYYQSDYLVQALGAPVGMTTTDANGRWVNTILVKPGFTYVVQFIKQNEFGPNTATIIA